MKQCSMQEIQIMKHTNTIIIGGGQAGLAMGRCLTEHGIEHVILERGRIGERWRSERWDSLRMLTPNWQSRLPHWHYAGDDPDGFMTISDFIRHLEGYARSTEAPVQTDTTVLAVNRMDDARFKVTTDKGEWVAANVVIATGFCDTPRVPEFAAALTDDVLQIVPSTYRNPRQLPDGGVLVVGASATGLQISDELVNAGHEVTLAVGTHIRVPRRYRGKDILYWMDTMGAFAAPADPADERKAPPPQLVGSPENRDLDVGVLQDKGVRLTGRVTGVRDGQIFFADDLWTTVGAADEGMIQLLSKIDGYITSHGIEAPATEPGAVKRIEPRAAPSEVDLAADNIRTVVWATGYERRYPWLKIPVLDECGEIRHDGGVTPVSGLYVLGIRFQRRKYSNLIDGVGRDAEDLSRHLAGRMYDRAA
jgi:putative flavoprotein involved in K+ transport